MKKRLLNGIGYGVAFSIVPTIIVGSLILNDRVRNPMAYVPVSYGIVHNTREETYQKEGWTPKEISRLTFVGDPNVQPGEIIAIPQKDKLEELGNSGEKLYATKEEAETAYRNRN